jgi:hypothetical protein
MQNKTKVKPRKRKANTKQTQSKAKNQAKITKCTNTLQGGVHDRLSSTSSFYDFPNQRKSLYPFAGVTGTTLRDSRRVVKGATPTRPMLVLAIAVADP